MMVVKVWPDGKYLLDVMNLKLFGCLTFNHGLDQRENCGLLSHLEHHQG